MKYILALFFPIISCRFNKGWRFVTTTTQSKTMSSETTTAATEYLTPQARIIDSTTKMITKIFQGKFNYINFIFNYILKFLYGLSLLLITLSM